MRTRLQVVDFAMAALKAIGVHHSECQAYKVIGRFGSRSGLYWVEGDLSKCTCRLGDSIKALAETRSLDLEPSLRKGRFAR